jgi:protein transport protein SEC24
MPSIRQDQSYSIEVQIDENINSPFVVFQTAVLHTSSEGERRIRVITFALPTTSNLSELYSSADQIAIATFLSSKAVERLMSMTASGTGASAQLNIADNLKMLPLLCLGLVKHVSPQFPPLHVLAVMHSTGRVTAQHTNPS